MKTDVSLAACVLPGVALSAHFVSVLLIGLAALCGCSREAAQPSAAKAASAGTGSPAAETERSRVRRELIAGTNFDAAVERALASGDPLVRRFALAELALRDPQAAVARARKMTDDPAEEVQSYLVEIGATIKDRRERLAFFGAIAAKSRYPSVIKKAESRGGFPFFRHNVALSKDPANDHDMNVLGRFPLPLEGWAFATDPKRKGHLGARPYQALDFDDASWKRIPITDCWEKFGFAGYDGIGWYRVTFTLPAKPAGTVSSELCFDAVDEEAWVWLNGTYLGQHAEGTTGWDIPFRLGADAELKWGGENALVVRVNDTCGGGGIWKGVRVEALK